MSPEEYILLCVYILAGLIGLCVGSFLNVVIYRVPNGMSLSKPGSHCTTCDYSLKWYDNIPVLSYVFLGGRCRKCKQRISPRYMLVEIFNALLWVLSVYLFWEDNIGYAVISAIVLSTLVCIFFIDLEHMLIFDRFNVIIFLAGIAAVGFDRYARWYDHFIGAAVSGLSFLAIYYIAIKVFGREGIGFGDVKLAFVSGMLLGWQKFLLSILISSISASIILLTVRKVRGDEHHTEYPFGPFLAIGIAISMLVGEPIINWYLSLLGV